MSSVGTEPREQGDTCFSLRPCSVSPRLIHVVATLVRHAETIAATPCGRKAGSVKTTHSQGRRLPLALGGGVWVKVV